MLAPRRQLAAAITVAAMLAGAATGAGADARPFDLRSASVREVDGVYLLDAQARLRLTPAVRRALRNGVTLAINWHIDIDRERGWWLDADVAEIAQRYRIEYHELSLQYLVTNLNTGERRSFVDLDVALDHIGTLRGFPLVDRVLMDTPHRHTGHVQVHLDHGALPWPLRPTALFSSAWDLESQWHAWSFE